MVTKKDDWDKFYIVSQTVIGLFMVLLTSFIAFNQLPKIETGLNNWKASSPINFSNISPYVAPSCSQYHKEYPGFNTFESCSLENGTEYFLPYCFNVQDKEPCLINVTSLYHYAYNISFDGWVPNKTEECEYIIKNNITDYRVFGFQCSPN